jgi:hypothetical protein
MTQPENAWEAARAVMRGLVAVAVLIITAADALMTAVIGVPPITWTWRRVRTVLSDEYRRGYYDAIEAEVISETGPGDGAPGGGA